MAEASSAVWSVLRLTVDAAKVKVYKLVPPRKP